MNLQTSMDQAFDNYLDLSEKLRSDVEMFLEVKLEDIRWKRNFVRTLVAVIEGYSHSLREIAVIRIKEIERKCEAPKLYKKEQQVLKSEIKFDACERIKFTLRGSYRLFELHPLPKFGTKDWENAKKGLKRRNQLIHPKTPADLGITPETWEQIYDGLIWLFEQNCTFFRLLYTKHNQQHT